MMPATYLESFSLQMPPFEKESDERFFYNGSAVIQRLDLLAHLTQFGESVMLVCGPQGSGKSTMLRSYIAHAGPQWRVCSMHANIFGQFTSLLAHTLNGDANLKADQLISQWAAQSDVSQLLVIAIDDAEQLGDAAFRRLSVLLDHMYGERIRLILFGSDQLSENYKKAFEQQLITRSPQLLEMPRLSEEETAAYITYRLAIAGYSGECPLSTIEIRGICKAGDGRPGAINRLTHAALEEFEARSKSKRPPVQTKPHRDSTGMWIIAGIVSVCATIYLGWQQQSTSSDADEISLSLPQTSKPAPVVKPQIKTATPQSDAFIEILEAAASHPSEEPTSSVAEEDAGTQTIALTLPAETKPVPESILEPTPEPAPEPEPPVTLAVKTPLAPEPASKLEPDTAKLITEASPPAAEKVTPAEPVIEKEETSTHRESWLLQQTSSSYSLQLLGSRSEQNLSRFIQKHKLDPAQAAYYQGTHKGSAWHVLLYGVYSSRDTAVAAREKLPAAVRKGSPWPRKMDAIQAAIRDRKNSP